MRPTTALLLLALASPAAAQAPDTTRPALIPWPAAYRADTGRWIPTREISLRALQSIQTSHEILNEQARRIVEESFGAPTSGWVMRGPDARAVVQLLLTPGGTPDSMREAYHLKVSPHRILIEAGTETGLFYGLQTLRQLAASPGNGPRLGVPAVEIWDHPRFQWRGLHLDVTRHFFPVEFVERYIDLMARYKYNTFHWHLTDDQGWRIEINGYPRLTSVGAWRRETVLGKNIAPYIGDSIPYGGYYTQEEIREVVRYAAERHVTIVPEIEMPGHAKAAVAAYPELACTPGPFEVGTVWGVEDDIYCPTEHTFKMLEDVLTQVMALFPSRFIHVGGDEVPKIRWQQSRFAQELMHREGLRNEEELQSWFVRRIERFLNAHGRRLIGWDEILEGGIAPEATVMSWRGTAGGIVAAQAGHDVIMTPGSHVYFDHLQGPQVTEPLSIGGYTPLEKVYAFEPVPAELTATQAQHILGAQANMWTEYVATPAHVEYMVYPRALALSEVLWSPVTTHDWTGFTGRLPTVLRTLDALRVNYRIPDVAGLEGGDQLTLADSAMVALRAPAAGRIRYTLDGNAPTPQSPTYSAPLSLHFGEKPIAVTARLETADGRLGMPRTASWRRAKWFDAPRKDASGLLPGVGYSYAEGRADSVAAAAALPTMGSGFVSTVQLAGNERAERFAVTIDGWLQVPADALYEFSLSSDDGSVLWIDGQKVVDNDGYHGADPKQGAAALRIGMHRVKIVMFQGGGAKSLALGWRRQGDAAFYPVPSTALFRSQ